MFGCPFPPRSYASSWVKLRAFGTIWSYYTDARGRWKSCFLCLKHNTGCVASLFSGHGVTLLLQKYKCGQLGMFTKIIVLELGSETSDTGRPLCYVPGACRMTTDYFPRGLSTAQASYLHRRTRQRTIWYLPPKPQKHPVI